MKRKIWFFHNKWYLITFMFIILAPEQLIILKNKQARKWTFQPLHSRSVITSDHFICLTHPSSHWCRSTCHIGFWYETAVTNWWHWSIFWRPYCFVDLVEQELNYWLQVWGSGWDSLIQKTLSQLFPGRLPKDLLNNSVLAEATHHRKWYTAFMWGYDTAPFKNLFQSFMKREVRMVRKVPWWVSWNFFPQPPPSCTRTLHKPFFFLEDKFEIWTPQFL